MKITKIKDHSLINYLLPILDAYLKRLSVPFKDCTERPSKKEQTAWDIFDGIANITECIDLLHFSSELLDQHSAYESCNKINTTDYIFYSQENFYLRFTSVFDRCLRLANIIFDLGLPEKECKESTIIKNSKIQGTHLAKTLTKINKLTHPFRGIRNKVAHSENFRDSVLRNPIAFYCLADNNSYSCEKFRPHIEEDIHKYINTKKAELVSNIDNLEQYISSYFDLLLPIVKKRIDNIR